MKVMSITGASGVGKSTLEKALVAHFGGGRVRTITTRPPREGETSSDYDFQTRESLIGRTDLLWNVEIHGNLYSVAESEFDKAASETGGFAFVCITPERHDFLSDYFRPKGVRTIPVHLVSPGNVELERRLRARGESEEAILKRIDDSREFEANASKVERLNFVQPDTPEVVFAEVVRLYHDANTLK